jgi:hypothetical protein
MQQMIDLLWSKIEESYEAQARKCDGEAVSYQRKASFFDEYYLHKNKQRRHNLEHQIAELEAQQPDSYEKEVQQVNTFTDQADPRMPAEGEPVPEWVRKQYNAERVRQLKIELSLSRFHAGEFEIAIHEYEAEALRFQERASKIRNKISTIQKMPNLCLQIKQLYYEDQARKCDEKAFTFQMNESSSRIELFGKESEIRRYDHRVSIEYLKDPQPAPFWQEVEDTLQEMRYDSRLNLLFRHSPEDDDLRKFRTIQFKRSQKKMALDYMEDGSPPIKVETLAVWESPETRTIRKGFEHILFRIRPPIEVKTLAGWESPEAWEIRKRFNECTQIRRRKEITELNRDVLEQADELCKYQDQAHQWQEKALQFRNKASALMLEPTPDIELSERSERSALLDSSKRSNYQAIASNTI